MQYKFQIKYLLGKRNSAVDFLSHYPTLCALPDATDEEQASDMKAAMSAATVATFDGSDCIVLDSMAVAAEELDYQLLLAKVTVGDWHPHRAQELACLRQFYGVRHRLAVSQGLMTYTYEQESIRLVIHKAFRQQVAVNLLLL